MQCRNRLRIYGDVRLITLPSTGLSIGKLKGFTCAGGGGGAGTRLTRNWISGNCHFVSCFKSDSKAPGSVTVTGSGAVGLKAALMSIACWTIVNTDSTRLDPGLAGSAIVIGLYFF